MAIVGLGVGLRALTTGLGGWDARSVVAVAHRRGPVVISAAHVASWLGRSFIVLALAVVAGLLLRRGGRARVPLLAVGFAIIVHDAVMEIVRRPRPTVVHLEHVTSWSFPSGHATESAALCLGTLAAAWPSLHTRARRGVAAACALAVALLVAASRVVLGVHYPTDVAAGAVLGALSAGLAVLLADGRTSVALGGERRWSR